MHGGTRSELAHLNDAMAPIPPITVRPVNVMDEAAFPEMALARKHLASLTPERRAELNEGWTDA